MPDELNLINERVSTSIKLRNWSGIKITLEFKRSDIITSDTVGVSGDYEVISSNQKEVF